MTKLLVRRANKHPTYHLHIRLIARPTTIASLTIPHPPPFALSMPPAPTLLTLSVHAGALLPSRYAASTSVHPTEQLRAVTRLSSAGVSLLLRGCSVILSASIWAAMLSANCFAVGDELARRLSASTSTAASAARRLSPIGSAVLARLHALQTVSREHSQLMPPSDSDAGVMQEGRLEQSCEFDEMLNSHQSSSVSSSSAVDDLAACDCGRFEWSASELSVSELSAAVDCVHRVALAADSVWLESVLMQVEFETLYALSSHCRDIDRQRLEAAQLKRVDDLLAIDIRSAQSASQPSVVSFYSILFQLCMHSPALSSECQTDRTVQREVAAAVESVFPLSHLAEHAAKDAAARRSELLGLADLVLGIRLFNQQIGKGGARLQLRAELLTATIAKHNAQLEQESVFIGEIANTYTALLAHFHANHGQTQDRQRRQEEEKQQMAQHSAQHASANGSNGSSGSHHSSRTASATAGSNGILAPFPSCLLDASRVHCELIHRRQYLLFLHALQSEGSLGVAAVQSLSQQLDELFSQLTSIVGLRAAVPKHTVFPAFERVGALYRQLGDESAAAELRQRLLTQLQDSRNPFITSLTTAHIRQCKELQQSAAQLPEPAQSEFDQFVATVNDADSTTNTDSSASDDCVRVTADSSASFMSVALAYQGYCCVTLVRHSGFLLAGDAALGVIRYRQTHFAFASIACMRAFVRQPQRFIQQVQQCVAVQYPPLIHLMCLQANIPHTDIALYITDQMVQAAHKHTTTASQQQQQPQQRKGAAAFFPPLKHAMQAGATQTPTHFPSPSSSAEGAGGLQSLHWNEWEMRRRAIAMADMRSKATHTTQTDKSHFRRDNGSQYTLPNRTADGTVDAKGTQTTIDKSTNSERTSVFIAGLRTDPKQQAHSTIIKVTLPVLIGEPTNPNLTTSAR